MITLTAFNRLRAEDYIAEDVLGADDDWRFLGRVWRSSGVGFTDFLALPSAPDVTRRVCVDLVDTESVDVKRLLRDLDLRLEAGMGLEEVTALLGLPVQKRGYVADRTTYEFAIGDLPWTMDATIHSVEGLIYLVIHPPLP